jgi:hypothetical protein
MKICRMRVSFKFRRNGDITNAGDFGGDCGYDDWE